MRRKDISELRVSFISRFLQFLSRKDEENPWTVITTFMLPAVIIYTVFTAYPVIRTFYNSVCIIKPHQADKFVGLQNFIELLTTDKIFLKAVVNTLVWATVAPVVDVILGLFLALFLYVKIPFSRVFRVAWFTPVLISYVVVSIIWMWIYNPDWGVFNGILRLVGLESWTRAWLGNPSTALPVLILTDVWKWVGFHMVVCLAALHALPSEVIEAAELDNCNWVSKLIFVMVPMIRPTIVSLLIVSFIGKVKVFDLVWIMTRGGPLWSTETASTYVYKRAFDWGTFDLGYPSAVAVIWFLVALVFTLIISWLFRQREKLEY